jgi:UDP-N-acetylglucosamine:LPS N-acetylglucosamine transferase
MARILDEGRLSELSTAVTSLLDDHGSLEAMKQAARAVARPQAADAIADLIIEAGRS